MRKLVIGLLMVLGMSAVGDAQISWPKPRPVFDYRCATVTHDTGRAFNLVDAETGVVWMALPNGIPGETQTSTWCWWIAR